MPYLLAVSLIWGLSFPLVKIGFPGVDPWALAGGRLVLALGVFLPFVRPLPIRWAGGLMALGGLQFGLMYAWYFQAYAYLPAWQIALFTAFTPLFVTLISDALSGRVRFVALAAALLAVMGAAVLRYEAAAWSAQRTGFLLMQASNLAFATGQVLYRSWRRGSLSAHADHHLIGWMYGGGALVATIMAGASGSIGELAALSRDQWLTLLYLGVVASGLCFFGWNAGAVRVSSATLAVMNNLKVPAGLAFAFLLGERLVEPARLAVSLLLIGVALALAQRGARPTVTKRSAPAG